MIILVGVVIFLIGFGMFFNAPSTYLVNSHQPNPPILGPLSYLISVACFFIAIYCFIQLVDNTSNGSLYVYLALTIVSGLLTKGAFTFGREAAQNHARDSKALADAAGETLRRRQNEVALEYVEENAEYDQQLKREKTQTGIFEQQVTRTRLAVAEQEAILRSETIPTARQAGLSVDGVYEVNKHKYIKQIDLRTRWEETEQDLTAADFADSSQQRQVLAERTKELEQMIRERNRIANEELEEYVKSRLLDRYDKGIQNLEAEIESREARLVLPKNTQENRRLT